MSSQRSPRASQARQPRRPGFRLAKPSLGRASWSWDHLWVGAVKYPMAWDRAGLGLDVSETEVICTPILMNLDVRQESAMG